MAYEISTNNVDEWKVIDTVSELVIAEFKTELEVKKFLAVNAVYEGKLKAIKILMSYPDQIVVNDKLQRTKTGIDDYTDWLLSKPYHETPEKYHKTIDDKLEELLNSK